MNWYKLYKYCNTKYTYACVMYNCACVCRFTVHLHVLNKKNTPRSGIVLDYSLLCRRHMDTEGVLENTLLFAL